MTQGCQAFKICSNPIVSSLYIATNSVALVKKNATKGPESGVNGQSSGSNGSLQKLRASGSHPAKLTFRSRPGSRLPLFQKIDDVFRADSNRRCDQDPLATSKSKEQGVPERGILGGIEGNSVSGESTKFLVFEHGHLPDFLCQPAQKKQSQIPPPPIPLRNPSRFWLQYSGGFQVEAGPETGRRRAKS